MTWAIEYVLYYMDVIRNLNTYTYGPSSFTVRFARPLGLSRLVRVAVRVTRHTSCVPPYLTMHQAKPRSCSVSIYYYFSCSFTIQLLHVRAF